MYKLQFFVVCRGWKAGGYKNTCYFETKKDAREYLKNNNLKLISLKKVTLKEFSDDYMG